MKRKIREIKNVLTGLLLIGGIGFWWIEGSNNVVLFFVVIIAAPIIPEIIFYFVPTNKSKKPKNKASNQTTTKQKSNKNSSPVKKKTDKEIIATPYMELDGNDFEKLVAMYYEEKGYKPELTKGSGDHGVDLILTDPKENYRIAVQIKRWTSKNVGNEVLGRLVGAKQIYKCLDVWCITTSDYTPKAKEFAELSNIRIFNGLYVQTTIGEWQKKKMNSFKGKQLR